MNENKYDEALKKATKEALENDFDSLDFYMDMKYIETDIEMFRVKKKSGHFRHLAIVASVLLIFTLSSVFAVLISNGAVSASKFKLEQQLIKLKNLLTTEDENKYKEDVGNDNIVLEIKSQDEIKRAQGFFSDLIISNNIPQRFSFESLTVLKLSNGLYKANYLFKDIDGNLLTINQESISREGMSTSIINSTEKIKTDNGTIFIFENPFGDETNAATYLTDNFIIDVNGMIEIDEITDIMTNIKPL